MDRQLLADLLEHQDGVICRRQVRTCGGGDHHIRGMVRRREWVVVHNGVYVNHTGTLSWRQRAWAAVLYAGAGAALDRDSALRADGGPGWRGRSDDEPIQVAVDVSRTVKPLADIRIRRVRGLADKVRPASPPRLRVEEAALEMAATCPSDHDAFEYLARAVRSRSTSAVRLLAALENRTRVRRRQWLIDTPTDIRDGSFSVLEQGYLIRVERAHGLPNGYRQRHETNARDHSCYRDVDYAEQHTVAELDGRVHDRPEQRDDDLDRDLDVAAELRVTLRVGWGQVFRRGCRTAARVARVLQQRGWQGAPRPCGPGCEVGGATTA